ncbi:hypothetical protein COU61_01800 [Candidatus Pacearchaeota archaeon CG10_big_fil_rev_8_21_14_0_10_35_13]|nr:MAG: hypothetical protein COU61_01800 [Candidatus Pacearchaeota archaeon CG10_big_fil_rev_8_21_14_0_10_35_13]
MEKIETFLFWLLIALMIGVALWKLVGSPTDTASLIAVTLFITGSETLLWKSLFRMDKKATIGFLKMKNHMDYEFKNINNEFRIINNKLEMIMEK